jgi:FCP1-like phosphatase family protein
MSAQTADLPVDDSTQMYDMINGFTMTQEATQSFFDYFTYFGDSLSLPVVSEEKLEEKNPLLAQKKLSLALDLDNTLLHATADPRIIQLFRTTYGLDATTNHYDLYLLNVDDSPLLVKLRPSLLSFLHKAKELFEINIFTMGLKSYALAVAEVLDPQHNFINRIVSREDFPTTDCKTLDFAFPDTQNSVVIIDDRRDVWCHNLSQLIQISPYDYFREHFGSQEGVLDFCPSPLTADFDTIFEHDAHLDATFEMLTEIHTRFFEATGIERDVRTIMKRNVLKDVHIYFSGLQCRYFEPRMSREWLIAEALGATCYETFTGKDGSVNPITHVVVLNKKRVKELGDRTDIFVVNESWLEICVALCYRVDEFNHTIVHYEPDEPLLDNDIWEIVPISEEYQPEYPHCNLKRKHTDLDDEEEQTNKRIKLSC